MLTTNNNDILFDDLATIQLMHFEGSSADHAIQYGDCGNRFEPETANSLKLDDNFSGYKDRLISYGDCGN